MFKPMVCHGLNFIINGNLLAFFLTNEKMKTILFPTDFSTNALHAAQYAGMIAKGMNANVFLLNVYSIPTISEYQLPNEIEKFINLNKSFASDNLREFTVKFIEKTGLSQDRIKQRIEYGYIADKILDTAREIKADMIVMGTKGASNILDKWLGTNAGNVMKTAECPVWIIPQNAKIEYPEKIMYAADFQEDELLATNKIMTIAQTFGSVCQVVHIHDYFEMNVAHHLEDTVHQLKEKFGKEYFSVTNLNRANIIEGLKTYIKKHKPDVLALAIHEKSFLSKIFFTSITEYFVQEAKMPILTFRK